MLQKLHINNYAIIEEIDIHFSSGLNIITGETGAGKSIIMGALSLILGARAESNVLFEKEKKCIVEASFDATSHEAIRLFLQENDLDQTNQLLIRREIAINGKSRAFINDTPVNLAQLKSLSNLIVDLHQQFDTLELGDNDFQRNVLDALADNQPLLNQYRPLYLQFIQVKKELELLRQEQTTAAAQQDYHRFLLDELDEIGLKENELESMDSELKLMTHAEEVKAQLAFITAGLNEGDQPLVHQLKFMQQKLSSLEAYDAGITALVARLQSARLEIEDVADELELINDKVQYNPERLQLLNERISVGYKLLKKHQVSSTAELLQIRETLSQNLLVTLNIQEAIQKKEAELLSLEKECRDLALQLSANRKKAVAPFEKMVGKLLFQVGMPNAAVKVQVTAQGAGNFNLYGQDEIEFLFDANQSKSADDSLHRFEPLRKVASGGELSRLMLCVKSLVAQKLQLPTLIFDEIDSGIGGEAAKQVGIIMKNLSANHQLIAITHQPQIAARADAHFFVYKSISGNRVNTSIRLLDADERITVIAQMLSGEKPTAAALENAREMVMN